MKTIDGGFRKLVLVCTNLRTDGRGCCAQKGSHEVYEKIKAELKELDPTIRTSQTGCLGHCATGTTVAVMPDNLWFGDVKDQDIPELLHVIQQT